MLQPRPSGKQKGKDPATLNGDCMGKDKIGKWQTQGKSEKAMLINPASGTPKAGIVLVPKRLALDSAAMHAAQAFARQGYACLALDLSKQPKTVDNVTTTELVAVLAKVKQSVGELRKSIGGGKVGLVGAWLGGTLALLAGESGADACAAVCPHLSLPMSDKSVLQQPLKTAARLEMPILAVFGELDGEIPLDEIRDLEKLLSQSPSDDESYTYPGVGHAFFDNEPGNSEYREPAERDLWMRIDRFFAAKMK
jgi:carboxymethylenebutenolidase